MSSTRRIPIAIALALPALMSASTVLADPPDDFDPTRAPAPVYQVVGQDGDVLQFEVMPGTAPPVHAARSLVPSQPDYEAVATDEYGLTTFALRPDAQATVLARPVRLAPAPVVQLEGAVLDDSSVMQFSPER
jgi:hypothetical protein